MYSQNHGSYHTFNGRVGATSDPNYRIPQSPSLSPSSSPGRPDFGVPQTNNINTGIFNPAGQFASQTIRMSLHEIQKADVGRKYARVDRRPLDPPPVVQLRIFRVYEDGNRVTESELDYEHVRDLGFLCTVDLFPAPGADFTSNRRLHATQYMPHPSSPRGTPGPSSRHSASHFAGYTLPPPDSSDIVHRVDGFPITEGSKQTQALVGATFVQPHLVDYQGNKAIVFVFSDLAVKIEGTFILRYRIFDIFSRPSIGVTAESYGGPFRVYSTKEFPGLAASTDLTKMLARWGVRLNIRETERRRRKKGDKSGDPTDLDDDDD